MDQQQLEQQLDLLIQKASSSSADIRFDGQGTIQTSINVCELAYRRDVITDDYKKQPGWLRWLLAERDKAPGLRSAACSDFQRCMSQSEIIDLSGALGLEGSEQVEKIRVLLRTCFETFRDATNLPGTDERVEAFAKVKKALEELEIEGRKRSKVRNKLARKWPVVTGLLTTVAREAFPLVRPNTHAPGPPGTVRGLLAGLPYEPGADPKIYEAYIRRFEELRPLFAARQAALGVNDMGLLGLSAWIGGYQYVVETRRQLQEMAQTARMQPTILQGPPGTGKTYAAEQLAEAFRAEHSEGEGKAIVPLDHFDPAASANVAVVTHLVQFHASYDYEDFVRGFRPAAAGSGMAFELQDGPFAKMVSLALRFPAVTFMLLVDEINRADLARVLGECIYLLDRRVPAKEVDEVLAGRKPGAVALRYRPTNPASPTEYDTTAGRLLARLCVPKNLVLVGTMNTADRSIAVVDIALRRRFAFYDLACDPGVIRTQFASKGFAEVKQYADTFIDWLEMLNGQPKEPGLINEQRYHLGHAYFLKPTLPELRMSIQRQVVPLLEEYRAEHRLRDDDEAIDNLLGKMRAFPEHVDE